MPFRADVYDDRAADHETLLLVRSDRAALPYYERLNCSNRDKLLADEFVLTADGSIYRPGPGVRVPASRYCLENEQREERLAGAAASGAASAIRAYVCAESYSPDAHDSAGSWKYVLTLAGFVPSIVCLALTLVVYAALSSLRNVHGYYVMCYVACLLLAFVCLLVIQWATIGSELCKFFGKRTAARPVDDSRSLTRVVRPGPGRVGSGPARAGLRNSPPVCVCVCVCQSGAHAKINY